MIRPHRPAAAALCRHAALDLAANMGWTVFPVYSPIWSDGSATPSCSCGIATCEHIGKHPRTAHGFKDATRDLDAIASWFDVSPEPNIGVPTGEANGIVVLDVDPRNAGDATLADLESRFGPIPATVEQSTGGGGRHFVFRHPGVRIGCRSGFRPGLDLKADGGYIVVAPSLHTSGRRYVWELSSRPGEVAIARMPAWLHELVTQGKRAEQPAPPGPIAGALDGGREDTDARESRCVAYLKKAPDAISGHGGHDATLRAACECYRFGLDDGAARRVMVWFNEHKTGGERWTEQELAHKLESAREKVAAEGAFGSRLASSLSTEMRSKRVAALRTDVGNAARLVRRCGNDIRFCHATGLWLIWDGKRWRPDDSGRIVRLCKKTALSILDEAKKLTGDELTEHTRWARKSQSRERLTAMAALAQPEVAVTPDELDADAWAFNCRNGTIDLRTGELRPHRQADLITKLAPVDYDANAHCPRFERFLGEVFGGDAELIAFVQRWHGYSLTGDIREQLLLIYHGEGGNGKSVLLDTISYVMGDYAGEAPPDLLVVRKHPEHPTEIADLLGKRLVVASETERGAELRLQLVKRITGNERLKARRMRQDFFEFARTHKLILVTNNRPLIREETEAAWRRLRLVPFDVVIPPERRDKDLMRKLRDEAPGILAWMVRGAVDWAREGLPEPESVVAATRAYRGASSSVDRFLAERCILGDGLSCSSADLIRAYCEWCARAGSVPLQGSALADELRRHGCRPMRQRGPRGWVGLELHPSPSLTHLTELTP